MIKFENTNVTGWEAAIRGMRNSHNSWDRSDSLFLTDDGDYYNLSGDTGPCYDYSDKEVILGENDYKLMVKLCKAGTDHRKFMRMITVYTDITAPLYFWKEFDTYKIGTVANSCSTMHSITDKEFTLDDFSHEHLLSETTEILKEYIDVLNDLRDAYLNFDEFYTKKEIEDLPNDKKAVWWQIIQLLPSSYNQRRTVMLNYEVLSNIYKSRRNHRLDEWSKKFIDWIRSLPYSELITGGEN